MSSFFTGRMINRQFYYWENWQARANHEYAEGIIKYGIDKRIQNEPMKDYGLLDRPGKVWAN
jgi:hypothetical protein